jgi:hypothetical protein
MQSPASSGRGPQELKEILERQVGHLRRSLAAYEHGIWEEAERLATSVFILVADGKGRTKPLLSQMGVRDTIPFVSQTTKSVVYVGLPICGVRPHEGSFRYFPLYMMDDTTPPTPRDTKRVSFQDWWSERIYQYKTNSLDRELFVRSLRSQDGGAHVDQELTDEGYKLIKTMGNDRIQIVDGKPMISLLLHGHELSEAEKQRLEGPPFRNAPLKGSHWAAMAHIAWELDRTITEASLVAPR